MSNNAFDTDLFSSSHEYTHKELLGQACGFANYFAAAARLPVSIAAYPLRDEGVQLVVSSLNYNSNPTGSGYTTVLYTTFNRDRVIDEIEKMFKTSVNLRSVFEQFEEDEPVMLL